MSDTHIVCLFRKKNPLITPYYLVAYTFLLVDEGEGLLIHLLVGKFIKHFRFLALSHLHHLVETHCEKMLT